MERGSTWKPENKLKKDAESAIGRGERKIEKKGSVRYINICI